MKWSESYTVNIHDLDQNGNMRPSAVLRCMQSAAYNQLEASPLCSEYLKSRSLAFILSKINIDFLKPLHKDDSVTVQSWPHGERGFSFFRSYRILRGDELCASACSVWALTDMQTRRLAKTGDVPSLPIDREEAAVSLPARIAVPSNDVLCPCGEYSVCFADIDANHHMNNTRYPDMLCNFIPDMDQKIVRALAINFQTEARQFESLQIMRAPLPDRIWYFQSMHGDGKTNIEAYVQTDAIY